MKKWILIVAVLTVSGCETLKPRTVSSAETGAPSRLEFQAGPEAVMAAAQVAIAEQKWKLLYSGTERPKDDHGFQSNNHFGGETDDQLAWSKSDQAGLEPTAYLQAKTPLAPSAGARNCSSLSMPPIPAAVSLPSRPRPARPSKRKSSAVTSASSAPPSTSV
ncbi:hypothetical protein ABH900_003666 [Stenotrophomonas sp. AN71]|uniref:hypothetical protein n=1 Tax=Stenotrophomonas sp. AN71 TaxID=3156253 RepID=UPI003D1ACF89